MRLVSICFFLLALHSTTQAQQVDLIANTEGRTTISLDGQWRTIIDPYESGYYDYRYQPSANGYFKDAKPKDKSDLIEYDFDSVRITEGAW
jgi:beta-glucuronidase